jgi:iron(III) transport system permease protein
VFKNFIQFFTLKNYTTVINHPTFIGAMINSLIIGLFASVIIIIPTAILAQLIHRGDKRYTQIFEFINTLPSAIPQLLLGLGLLAIYIGTPLFQSLWGLILCYIIMFIPYTLRTFSSAVLQVHKELEEAALIHGGTWFYNFRNILLPLLKPAIISAFFYMFIQIQRILGSVILITGPGLQLGPTVVFGYYRVGQWGECSASSIILASLILSYILIQRYVFNIGLQREV